MSIGLAANANRNVALENPPEFLDAVMALRALAADDLEAVNEQIITQMQSPVGLIPDLAGHLINAGGKRIRPVLTLITARMFHYEGDNHIKLAAAVELIHGATLLHDDVVDDSALRRGSETANVIWGNKESVLVGDFLFSRAFELMVAAKDLRVLQVLSHASGIIAQGEVLQLATQKNIETAFEQYLDVVDAKTAALFAAAAQSGALIANCKTEQQEAMRSYGRNLGIAYQLIDDALDYAGFEENLGKTVGDDFREGKMTLPVIYAIARARPEEKGFWRRVIAEGNQNEGDFAHALQLMERDNAITDTVACARQFAATALHDLAKAPSNDYSAALSDLVETSVLRAS